MEDWDINIEIVRSKSMSNESNIGEILHMRQHGKALISLADPIDHNNLKKAEVQLGSNSPQEESIIHELLHIYMSEWVPKTDLENELKEIALNRISEALHKLNETNK